MMKKLLTALLFLGGIQLYAQDTLRVKQVYLDQDIAYLEEGGARFTGMLESKRKNDLPSIQQYYQDGIIQSEVVYYKGNEVKPMFKTVYQAEKPGTYQKIFYYHKKKNKYRITSFDAEGNQVHIEQYVNGKLTYSCEYAGPKKHGKEICYKENGEQTVIEYEYGYPVSNNCD